MSAIQAMWREMPSLPISMLSPPTMTSRNSPEFSCLDELKAAYTAGGIGDMKCKKMLNKVLERMLEPIRKRRHEFEQDIPEIYNILRKGSDAAREVAAKTMDEVREAMRINYFDDAALIQEQAERFAQK